MTPVDANAGGKVRLEPVVGRLPSGFEVLREEASAEGHRHLDRLAVDWATGATRFDRPGEMLSAAYSYGVLVAVGGLTVDPHLPDALRMRRFYVRKSCRRCGIGRALAENLLRRARATVLLVTVNAAPDSWAFWGSLGFVADARDGHTHILGPNDRPDPEEEEANARRLRR